MKDEALSDIIEGINDQSSIDALDGYIKKQYLQSIIYTNNEFGIKSLEKMDLIIP